MSKKNSTRPRPSRPGDTAAARAEREAVANIKPGDNRDPVRDKKPVDSVDPAVFSRLINKAGR